MSLTSNRILDILILSAIFALVVMVWPVSADHTSPVGWPNVYAFYPNVSYPNWNDLPGIMPGQTVTVYSDGGGIYGIAILYFSSDGSICYNGAANWGGAMSGTHTVITGSCNGTRLYFRENTGVDPMVHMFAVGSGNTGSPIAGFSGTPTSGVGPLTVNFTDSSTAGSGTISSRLWDFGDGENSTATNPSHTYASSGQYTVSLTATNEYGSDTETKTNYITVYAVPVAAFSCSPTNTTSPDYVTCTDSSSGYPTTWLWQLTSYGVSMSPGGSYGAGIFSAVNSTQNPVFYMEGSGKVDVRLTVTNPGGSSENYKPEYITIAGTVPTPTPTPGVPWPNQTGVCIGSGITLGSGQTRDHAEHYQLTDPYGDTYSGIYPSGMANYIVNQPFFTALKGQYVYQERSAVDSTLEWQQSYITDYCVTPTSTTTATTTNIPVTAMPTVVNPYVTGGPTYNPYPVPTITLVNPNDTINIGSTWVNLTTIPTSLPPLPEGLNETHWREVTCNYGATGALLCPWMAVIYAIIGTASDFVFLLMSIGFLPLSFITTTYNFVSALSLSILTSWLSVGSIIIAVMGQLVNAIPDKVKNVVTLIMCLEIFKQLYELWDWVS